MGFVSVISPCICCGQLFSYNPYYVPSIKYQGDKHPVCGECVAAANLEREAKGLPRLEFHPLAYQPEECD
jgi:hypothetical protein